ncbi:MAG: membrane protein insertion efficiency factor YidD [Dehalococcoidia bacterium]|nr:MAG: membrane protein insertion efficiency factor YidD [Dehalococcoidia bacterium]
MAANHHVTGHSERLSLGQRAALALISWYQRAVSPNLGTRCRFAPSCSHYAADAIELYGLPRGISLAARRLIRCRPGGGSGFDPIPPRPNGKRP